MTTFVAGASLLAGGPPGWVVYSVLGLGSLALLGYGALHMANEKADEQTTKDDPKKTCSDCKKTPEEVLDGATRDPKKPTLKDGTAQYNKPGGMPQADQDFDSMQPGNVQSPTSGVRTGTLDDGTQVVVRPRSVPSLEINPASGPPRIIRYD